MMMVYGYVFVFFLQETATAEIYTSRHTLSQHDALPICLAGRRGAVSPAASPDMAQPDRHARGPALRIEVNVMRELEPARFARLVAQRDAHRTGLQIGRAHV